MQKNISSKLDKHLKMYLEYMEIEKNSSKLTIRNYKFYLNRFITWFEANYPQKDISDINIELVRKYRVWLSDYIDDYGITLMRVTQSYHVIALRSWLKWLVKNDVPVLHPEKVDLQKGSRHQ